MKTYLVGGAVRDNLLGRTAKDKDWVVVGATSEQLIDLGYVQVGKDFPVFLHPQTREEYALARTEKKEGVGYTGFICDASPNISLEDDLRRRDLTINAMAMTTDGVIIDPFKGQEDLTNGVLRHVSDAFIEDPLRVLRVARFAARFGDFSIAPETLSLMTTIAHAGELSSLTAERVWQEIQRTLTEPNPERFFEVLRQCQALGVIWPELNALWGVPNPALHHPEICSGVHTMMVLQQAVKLSSHLPIRFAALCHDLGKAITPKDELPSHKMHEKRGVPLVEKTCQRFKVPNEYKTLALNVCEFHLHAHKALELKATTILKLFNQLDLWRKPKEFEDFLMTCEADAKGRLGFENNDYPQARYLRHLAQLCQAVTAKPFIEQGLKGADIKEAIDQARIRVIAQQKQNHRHHHQNS